MKIRRKALLAAAVIGLAAPAAAQPPAEPAPFVEELVVKAYGGLAWWRVSDRDTTVWILALPNVPIPRDLEIDTTAVERRLRGANVLIGPAMGGRGMPLLAVSRLDRLLRDMNENAKNDLEPSLPPDLRARFVAQREKIGQPATRYGALNPGLAGMMLAGDARYAFEQAHPAADNNDVMALLTQAARRNKVRAIPAATYNTFPEMLTGGRKTGIACLASALDYIDKELKPRTAAKQAEYDRVIAAWLEGDIRPALEEAKTYEGPGEAGVSMAQFTIRRRQGSANMNVITGPCLDQMPAHRKVENNFVSDQTAAIRKALRKKGHAVAVVYPYPLLVKGGVLDTLRREGYTITTPAVPG